MDVGDVDGRVEGGKSGLVLAGERFLSLGIPVRAG